MKTAPFFSSVGIEYTFLSPPIYTGMFENYAGPTGVYHNIGPEHHYVGLLHKKGFKSAHKDGTRIVEVPSPIHHNIKEMRQFYNKLNKAAKSLRLKTHEIRMERGNEIHETPGGGHVHVGMPDFEDEAAKRKWWRYFTLAVMNRPWMNWVFNFWGDNWNANNIFTTNYKRHLKEYLKSDVYWELYERMEGDKDLAVIPRPEKGTLEWRIFDSPKDFMDAQNFVNFALAFTRVAYEDWTKEPSAARLHFRNSRQIKALDKEECWKKFIELLNRLDLDPKKYRRYKKNLNNRYAHGKLV